MAEPPRYLATAAGRLAYQMQEGRAPAVVFLPGFRSDMLGTKAEYLAQWFAARERGFVRFDYSGHGASDGAFVDGTISRWRDDALAVIDQLTQGPIVLVGSSMGGWIALLAALARPDRVARLVGIAPAPDFTEALIWQALSPVDRQTLLRDGVLMTPSAYGPPVPITRALIEDGRRHLLLHAPIALAMPVRLLHGQRDRDVPWQRSLTLGERLTSEDVQMTLIKDGDHRLSRVGDLEGLGVLVEG